MERAKVLIGIPTDEYARRADFYDHLNILQRPEDSLLLFCHHRSPARSRNLLIEAAQQNKCTHILFLDDDMEIPPDSLLRLLNHDKDIVSGLYLTGSYPHFPVAFDVVNDKGQCLPMYLFGKEERLYPIEAAGFGFLLVKLSVFDRLEKPYVRLGELDPEEWCDDIGFFNRARQAGIKSYIDLSVQLGHIRTVIYKPNFVNGAWHTGYNTGSPTLVNVPVYDPTIGYNFVDNSETKENSISKVVED